MAISDNVSKEICELQRETINEKLNGLEKRVFEAIKQVMTVSELSHSGNKDSLQSLLNMMQEGAYEEISKFENVDGRIGELDTAINILENKFSFVAERKEDIKKIQNLVTSLKLLKQAFESTKTNITEKIASTQKNCKEKMDADKKSIDKQLKHVRISLLLIGGILAIRLVAPEISLGELMTLLFKAVT